MLLVQLVFNVLGFPLIFSVMPRKYRLMLGFSDVKVADFLELGVPSLTFLANVICGVYALSKVNIPMFLAIRRLNALVVYISDVCIYRKPIKFLEFIGVFFISLGALLAGLADFTADYFGYALGMLNNFLTTTHLQLSKQASNRNPSLTAFTQTFYNAINSLPFLVGLCVYNTELAYFSSVERPLGLYLMLVLAALIGILLSVSTALCNIVNSPIITSISGNMKDLFLTFIGLFMFGDVVLNNSLLFGLGLSLTGACVFSYSKLKDQLKRDN
jgi:solute carrier family 35 protein